MPHFLCDYAGAVISPDYLLCLVQVFTQEEVDNVIVVKVTDTELGRYSYLTISKFEERLCDMR